MKVKYLVNSDGISLTAGKIYDVIEVSEYMGYKVQNDYGSEQFYYSSRFELVKDLSELDQLKAENAQLKSELAKLNTEIPSLVVMNSAPNGLYIIKDSKCDQLNGLVVHAYNKTIKVIRNELAVNQLHGRSVEQFYFNPSDCDNWDDQTGVLLYKQ